MSVQTRPPPRSAEAEGAATPPRAAITPLTLHAEVRSSQRERLSLMSNLLHLRGFMSYFTLSLCRVSAG